MQASALQHALSCKQLSSLPVSAPPPSAAPPGREGFHNPLTTMPDRAFQLEQHLYTQGCSCTAVVALAQMLLELQVASVIEVIPKRHLTTSSWSSGMCIAVYEGYNQERIWPRSTRGPCKPTCYILSQVRPMQWMFRIKCDAVTASGMLKSILRCTYQLSVAFAGVQESLNTGKQVQDAMT